MFSFPRRIFSALRIFLYSVLLLSSFWHGLVHAQDAFMEPQKAFKFSASMTDGQTVIVNFQIASGYYMYRERLKFVAAGVKLGEAQLPKGKVKYDETFQKDVETYTDLLSVRIPLEGSGPFTLTVTSQGCADAGLCYPPMESIAKLTATAPAASKSASAGSVAGSSANAASASSAANALIAAANPKASMSTPVAPSSGAAQVIAVPAPAAIEPVVVPVVAPVATAATSAAASKAPVVMESETNSVQSALKGGNLFIILPLFLGLGLALAFTPCVLPMVPILSFIIVGEGAAVSRMRGFLLSASYVLGMSIVYAMLGVASGLAGEGLSAALQNPWVLGAFGLVLAGLSLAMFDVYQLQMPATIQTKLITTSERQGRGKLFGVFVMGAISALIVGPCVTAPLFGTLVYISQTRDAVLGGLALFAMALGMGLPLILMGISAGQLLPKAGAWMDAVKRFFGVLLLGVALWIVAPVLPVVVQMLAWAILLVGYGAYLHHAPGGWFAKASATLFILLGAVQLLGVASGGRDAFAPLAHLQAKNAVETKHFQRVKTVAELDTVLAANRGKIVMLDFYADWCVSCKEMEKLTFPDPNVKAKMANMVLLQVDVTANDAADKEMLKRFHLFGPPGIIFFDRMGRELESRRVVGYQNASRFAASLDAVL